MNYRLDGYDNWLQGPARCTDCGAKYYQADGGCTDCADDLERWLDDIEMLVNDDNIQPLLDAGTFEGSAADWTFPEAQKFFDAGIQPDELVEDLVIPDIRIRKVGNW